MTDASSPSGLDLLSEKEREVLRLITRGHDAKSAAQRLGLSVHTINDRLRAARGKLKVTSSREAARILFEVEEEVGEPAAQTETDHSSPQKCAPKSLGDALGGAPPDPEPSAAHSARAGFWIGGFVLMLTLALAAALLTATADTSRPVGDTATPIETVQLEEWQDAALSWLALVDDSDWEASFAAAGEGFQKPNSIKTWREASLQARVPLGAVIARQSHTADFVAAPPNGYVVMKFHTDFAARKGAVEKVTLEKEPDGWSVVAYVID